MANAEDYKNFIGMGRIEVKHGSAYAHLSGQTFPIVEKFRNRISLNIDGITTDFYNCEVSVYTMSFGWMGYSLTTKWNVG